MDVHVDLSGVSIATQRLVLRPLQLADLPDFFAYASVPGVGEAAGWKHHESLGESEEILRALADSGEVLAIVHRADRKMIGTLGLHRSWANDVEEYGHYAVKDIGYVLSKDYWGQGLMPEAVRAVIAYGFDALKLDALTCCHFDQNNQSRRVIEKSGFRFVRKSTFASGSLGKTFDDMQYILMNGNPARHSAADALDRPPVCEKRGGDGGTSVDDSRKPQGCETCGRVCAANGRRMEPRPLPDEPNRLKWWLELSRAQTAKLWELLQGCLSQEQQAEILNQLGRNCARSIQWANRYVGDPDGFFKFMFDKCGEVISYDREAQVITVVTRERDCDCLLVNSGNISSVYCGCSIGWQQYTYETILGKKVNVTVEKAVLRGDLQCEFHIQVSDEPVTAG